MTRTRNRNRNTSTSTSGSGKNATNTSTSTWKQRLTSDEETRFLQRIRKSLYYAELPDLPCLSLPLTELASETFSEAQKGRSLKRLYVEEAAEFTRNACVSPCSLVLALLYLERLKADNPEYVKRIAPSELFFVSLMVSNKFLQDDGEDDSVIADEWAVNADISSELLIKLERDFLKAIDWKVFVSKNDFLKRLAELESEVALKQAKSRGWFTYADLANTIVSFENIQLLKCLVTVYLALSISYIASISMLMISSVITRETAILVNSPRLPAFNVADTAPAVNDTSDMTVQIDIEIDNVLINDEIQNELNYSRTFLQDHIFNNPLFFNYRQTLLDSINYFYKRDEPPDSNCDNINRHVFSKHNCKNIAYLSPVRTQLRTLLSSC